MCSYIAPGWELHSRRLVEAWQVGVVMDWMKVNRLKFSPNKGKGLPPDQIPFLETGSPGKDGVVLSHPITQDFSLGLLLDPALQVLDAQAEAMAG